MKNQNIQHIVKERLCIGCGLCAAICPVSCITMTWGTTKQWIPFLNTNKCINCGQCYRICPNEISNLEKVGKEACLYEKLYGLKCDAFHSYYISYEINTENRLRSASGGLTTTLLKSLLVHKKVDCVIAAKAKKGQIGEPHFEATICRTPAELDECRSSSYGPVNYEHVLREFIHSDELYSVVALPCILRALDTLPLSARERLKYTIGISCSHNVTDQFGDYMARRHSVKGRTEFHINYRDKKNIPDANNFNTAFYLGSNAEVRTPRMLNGFNPAWRGYWFAYEGCLYCPDFYAAGADISVKDAWGRLSEDPKGITLCIVRNNEIEQWLKKLRDDGTLYLEACDVDEIQKSQDSTAIFKQINFLARWHQKKSLNPLVKKIAPHFIPERTLISDYWTKRKSLKMTQFVFKGSTLVGFWILEIWNNQRIVRKHVVEMVKRYLNMFTRMLRRIYGTIGRLLGFLTPRRWDEVSSTGIPLAWGCECDNGLRVLITGGYGYRNVGDEAQLGANLERWRAFQKNSNIIVFSPNPEYTKNTHNIKSFYGPRIIWFSAHKNSDYGLSNKRFEKKFWRLRCRMLFSAHFLRAGLSCLFCSLDEFSLLSLIAQADVLHISGGGFMTGMTRSRLWENCLLLRLCYLLGTKVIMTGHTVGVFRNKKDRMLAKWGLKHVEYLTFRDRGFSEKEVNSLGICGPHVKTTFDDALFCGKATAADVIAILRENNICTDQPFIAANFHYWGQSDEMKKKAAKRFAELCDHLADCSSCSIVFIPMAPSDKQAQEDVVALMSTNAVVINSPYDYRLIRGVIAAASIVFTMKHHPIIFAFGEGVPVVSVALDPYYVQKNKGAMEMFDQGNYFLDETLFFSPQSNSTLSNLWQLRRDEKKKIEKECERLRGYDGESIRDFINRDRANIR